MNKRIYYFDRLRIISAIAVILIHICGRGIYSHRLISAEWNIYNIVNSFSRFAVPMFIMMSGALFLSPEKNITIKSIYTKYILRILVAFLSWSIIYASVYYSGSAISFVKDIIRGYQHMYFLYIIVGLYMATPILRKVCEDERLMRYYMLLSVFFSFLLPILPKLPHMAFLAEGFERLGFQIGIGYSAYFVGGYFLSTVDLKRWKRIILYVAGIAAFAFTVAATQMQSAKNGTLSVDYYNGMSLNVMLWTFAIFTFFKYNLSKPAKTDRRSELLCGLSKLTFGVYLVHMLVLGIVDYLNILNGVSNVILLIVLKLILTFSVSLLITYLLSKVPVAKKYMV